MSTALRALKGAGAPGAPGLLRRAITVDARAVRYHKHGAPANVLRMETVRIDTAQMRPAEALVRMLAAPISPVDLAQVAGYGGKAPSFPRVGGNEGVGVVVEAGKDAHLSAGDFVVVSQPGVGTWSTHVVAAAEALTKLAPDAAPGSAALPVETASVAVAAPLTASALLGSVPLAEGDVIVQNDAGSIVGQAVIQAAAARGIRTVNILPGRPGDWADVVYHLQGIGATLVVDEAFARTPAFGKLLADLPPPKLGLDAAGGAAAAAVARALGARATLVTYGGRARSPLRLSSALFTAKGLTLSGLNPAAAVTGTGGKAARDAAVRAAVDDVRGGDASRVKLLLAREPFADFDIALQRSLDDAGDRTVVLTMPKA